MKRPFITLEPQFLELLTSVRVEKKKIWKQRQSGNSITPNLRHQSRGKRRGAGELWKSNFLMSNLIILRQQSSPFKFEESSTSTGLRFDSFRNFYTSNWIFRIQFEVEDQSLNDFDSTYCCRCSRWIRGALIRQRTDSEGTAHQDASSSTPISRLGFSFGTIFW